MREPLGLQTIRKAPTKKAASSKLLARRGQPLMGFDFETISQSSRKSEISDCFSEKYVINRSNFKGRGSCASVYALDLNQSPHQVSSADTEEPKVVKICNTSDEANLDAAKNEVRILEALPPHPNIVRYFEHYFKEETG